MKQRFKFRSRPRRGVGVFFAIVVVALAALVLGGSAWFFGLVSVAAPPIPQLLQSLPEQPSQEWFEQRLREHFPVASPEADLIRELWLEGFLPRTNLRADRRTAEFDSAEKGGYRRCHLTASVSWTADEKGQLTRIDGGYAETCP